MLEGLAVALAATAGIWEPAAESGGGLSGLPPPPTPRVLTIADPGRFLRGDWERTDEVLVVYNQTWPRVIGELVRALAPATEVTLLHDTDVDLRQVRRFWRELPRELRPHVEVVDIAVDSAWVRDFGPFEVKINRQRAWVDAEYDPGRSRDDSLPGYLAGQRKRRLIDYTDWIEGGAFISNGRGLCAATLEYFDLRGPSLTEPARMAEMQRTLGCRVLALVPSLSSEPTRHVDMIAQFVSPDRLLVVRGDEEHEDEHEDEDEQALRDMVTTLEAAAKQLDTRLEIIEVPARYSDDGNLRSYANGLRVNDRYLVPQYGKGDALDQRALATVRAALPDLKIIGIDALLPAQHGGALHCITLGLRR